jgi:signal transduction histidine kinase
MQTPPTPKYDSVPPPATIAELTALVEHLQTTLEQERWALTRVLHDDLGALMVSAAMDAGWLAQNLTLDSAADLRLDRIRTGLAAAIDLKRGLTEKLRPSLLDNFGLIAAYRWHLASRCEQAGVTCTEYYPDEELCLRPAALAGLFRIMQEIVTVILAEDEVQSLDVGVRTEQDSLELRIAHMHAEAELIDPVGHRPIQMAAVMHRVATLGGRMHIGSDAVSTTMTMRFARSMLEPDGSQPNG